MDRPATAPAASSEPAASPADEISAGRAAFVAALSRSDAAAAAALYTTDARLLAPSAELIRGRQSIEAFWRAGLESGVAAITLEALELRLQGDLAFEIGRYELRVQSADTGAGFDRGKYLLVHRRESDGSWRRAVEMFDSDGSVTRPATASEGLSSELGRIETHAGGG